MPYGKILLIENIPRLRRMISDYLQEAGMEVMSFASVDMFSASAAANADVIVLSSELFPKGISSPLAQLRCGRCIPAIAVRSRVSEHSEERLISEGADDVVTRPMSIELLHSAISRQLERVRPLDLLPLQDSYSHGGLCADIRRCTVTCDSKEVSISPKQLQLLHLLLSRKNYVFAHGELISRVWGTSNVNHHTLTVHINQIKKKIGGYGSLIRSVRSSGYFFADEE